MINEIYFSLLKVFLFLNLSFLGLINASIVLRKIYYEVDEDLVIVNYTEFCEVSSDEAEVLEDSQDKTCQMPSTSSYNSSNVCKM